MYKGEVTDDSELEALGEDVPLFGRLFGLGVGDGGVKERGTVSLTLGGKIGDRGAFVGACRGKLEARVRDGEGDVGTLTLGEKIGDRGSGAGVCTAEGRGEGHLLGADDGASDGVRVGDGEGDARLSTLGGKIADRGSCAGVWTSNADGKVDGREDG
eukprot:scaffold16330_cov172-Amphora_coffeaeformis.AAC.3